MNILHAVHSTNPRKGGVIETVVLFARALEALGHASEVISIDPPQTRHENTKGLTVHCLGPGAGEYGYTGQLTPWITNNHTRFDAVIIHGIWQYHSLGTWRALKNTSTPYYILPQGMLDPWFKKKYPLKHLKKWLYWKLFEQRVFRDARRILFTCQKESELAFQCFKPCNTPREITSLGVDIPDINENEAKSNFYAHHPHLKGKRLLLYIGRIDEKKGVNLLIEAFKQVLSLRDSNELNLAIAGPCQKPAYLDKLKSLAGDAQASIHFLPMLSGPLKWGSFYASEALIVPTHQENFGLVFAEAMACNLPVLTTTGVNIGDTIKNSGAGFIEPDTTEGITTLLNRWLDLSPHNKAIMRTQSHDCFKQHFEIRQCAKHLAHVIQQSL